MKRLETTGSLDEKKLIFLPVRVGWFWESNRPDDGS
jgi:hypothetical protein